MPIPRKARRLTGGQGLLKDELPLRPDLSIAPDRLQLLLSVKGPNEVKAASCCIIANAILAHWQGARIHYSRDNSFYAAVRAGAPSWFSRRVIAAAVDQLGADGVL